MPPFSRRRSLYRAHARFILAVLGQLLVAATIGAGPKLPPKEYARGLEAVHEREIRAWISLLCASELEGRDAGERGYNVAARYVASVFMGLGVEPGASDGTYLQEFDLVRRRRMFEQSRLVVTPAGEAGGAAQAMECSSIALKGQAAVWGLGGIDWTDPWLFVGPGLGARADAPDHLYGQPLSGRVVVLLPPQGEHRSPQAETASVRRRGARKIIVISDRRSESRRWRGGARRRLRHDADLAFRPLDGAQVVYLSTSVANRVLAAMGRSVEELRGGSSAVPFDSGELKIRLTIPEDEQVFPTSNVVGILPGRDPQLRDEYVVLGAHLDHIGVRKGKVYRGADDNASGVSMVMAVAKGLVENPTRPRRSVVFVLFGAEEIGLLGSKYFVSNAPVPLERIAVYFNFDMVGRDEESKDEKASENRNSMHLVGARKHSRELQAWIERVNEFAGLDLETDEERVFRRSDQLWFARRGVPVTFFFAGFHSDYHKPTDTPEKLNYPKLSRLYRLAYAITFEVANRRQRLSNDRI